MANETQLTTITYQTTGRIARITLNRPERGNGITLEMPGEIAACVELANLDPEVSVIALAGNGKAFVAAMTWCSPLNTDSLRTRPRMARLAHLSIRTCSSRIMIREKSGTR